MTLFPNLPTAAQVNAVRRATPKGIPTVLAKAEKKKSKEKAEKEFRAAVWARDKGQSRATGKPLAKSGTDYDRVGEVHHVLKRSTHPDAVYDPTNGLLLSKTEHRLAETACPNAPDKMLLDITGPDDRGKPQKFVWRDIHGKATKTRTN